MAEVGKVRIAYTGSALADGAMDVNDLAPALLAFGALVKRANTVIGNKQPVNVMLKADDIRVGSFDVVLELVYSGLDQVKLMLGVAEDTGIKALIDVLGMGVTVKEGVFWLIQTIGTKKVARTEKADGEKINIIFSDNSHVTVTQNTYNVYMDYEARGHITKVVAPIKKDGIDSFEIRNARNYTDKKPSFQAVKDELELYATPELATKVEPDNVFEQEILLKIVSLVFDENQKWRFSDGEVTFWAKIEDADFWKSIDEGMLAFKKGDRLKVRCKTTQKTDSYDNISTERTIVKVIKLLPKPTQIKLNFEYDK